MSYVKASVYLTFDDGPDMQLTSEQARNLRDILIEAVGLPQVLQKHTAAVLEEMHDKLKKCRSQYNDLIMEVAIKHPDESRHETAKRYIVQAEADNPLPESSCNHNEPV